MNFEEKIKKLYPTARSITEAKKKYSSWAIMAKAIGVPESCLYTHRSSLGMVRKAKKAAAKELKSFADRLTSAQIDENIKKLVKGQSKNTVTKYKIVALEAFRKDQRGYNGLQLIGVESGSTWGQARRNVPYAISGRGL